MRAAYPPLGGVSAFELMEARKLAGYVAGVSPSDGKTLRLAISAGGMGGAQEAGMVAALWHLGYGHVFDEIYASSSGAIIAPYLMTGEAVRGVRGFDRAMPRKSGPGMRHGPFVDWWRFITWEGPLVSLNRLFEVMDGENSLDWDAALHSPINLNIVVTDPLTGNAEVLHGFKTKKELQDAMRCSCYIPKVFGLEVPTFRGKEYVDPLFSAPNPWKLDLDRTDETKFTLILKGKPWGYIHPRIPFLIEVLTWFQRASWKYPELWKGFRRIQWTLNTSMDGVNDRVSVVMLPKGQKHLSRWKSLTQKAIYGSIIAGFRAMAEALDDNNVGMALPPDLAPDANPMFPPLTTKSVP